MRQRRDRCVLRLVLPALAMAACSAVLEANGGSETDAGQPRLIGGAHGGMDATDPASETASGRRPGGRDAGAAGCAPAADAPPRTASLCADTRTTACRQTLLIEGCRALFYSSYDLGGYNPDVTRGVIAIHGIERGDSTQFATVLDIVTDAGRLDEIVVLAPLYPGSRDVDSVDHWVFGGYQTGAPGRCDGSAQAHMSSFVYTDALVDFLADCNRFPNLEQIVLIGHSAGGQHVGRYAAVTHVVDRYPEISFKFVPTNPSTWPFLDARRKVDGRWSDDPSVLGSCRGYDDWGVGLQRLHRNPYLAGHDADAIRENWRSRNIVYFIGEADACQPTSTNGCNSMDTRCAANLQGLHRLARAGNMYESVMRHFPPFDHAVHELSVVPGVGHSSVRMYKSAAGRRHILK